jgi:hypothetical protein
MRKPDEAGIDNQATRMIGYSYLSPTPGGTMTNGKRTSGLGEPLITYAQANAGRVLTIEELMQNHPLGTTLERSQISSAMNNLVVRGIVPGLARGRARGTWVYTPGGKAAANPTLPPKDENLGVAIVDLVGMDKEGLYIGVDKDNGRVFKMERIA